MCWYHTMMVQNVVVRPSLIPNAGMGLFAYKPSALSSDAVVFRPGTNIVEYLGERLSEVEVTERYGSSKIYERVDTKVRKGDKLVWQKGPRQLIGAGSPSSLAPYIFKLRDVIDRPYIDAIASISSPARYVNDCTLPLRTLEELLEVQPVEDVVDAEIERRNAALLESLECNAQLISERKAGEWHVYVRATKDIRQNNEILVSYTSEGGYFKQ